MINHLFNDYKTKPSSENSGQMKGRAAIKVADSKFTPGKSELIDCFLGQTAG